MSEEIGMAEIDSGGTVHIGTNTSDARWRLRNGTALVGTVDFPGDLVLDVDGGSRVELTGKVAGTLRINYLNGQSVVLLGGLRVGAVESSKVDGQSTFEFFATSDVHLHDGINGQSHVSGTMRGVGDLLIDGWIDGQSSLEVDLSGTVNSGRGRVTFTDKIDGQSHVRLVLGGGDVHGKEVSGSSEVKYRKTAPFNPAVQFGPVHHGATVVEEIVLQPV
jgi:hypothetical protein